MRYDLKKINIYLNYFIDLLNKGNIYFKIIKNIK